MNSCASIHNKSRRQTGISLVELMVAITIGMLITAGLTTIFASNLQAGGEIERANRQLENGRYSMHLLTEDLRLAGFMGQFDPSILNGPSAMPDPCQTSLSSLKAAMPLHIQGYDNGASPSLSCLSDVRSGTDIVVLRRASTCVAGTTDCDGVSTGIPYFQASLCSDATELASGNKANFYALDTNTSNLTRHKRDCTTLADLRRYRTHIYFITNNTQGSDGIPTLKRAELGTNGSSTSFSIVPLAEGIENMQLEYGIDTNNNGAPDVYTANPNNYGDCNDADDEECVVNWRNVVAVRLHLLARNTESSAGHKDGKVYTLGLKEDGKANTVGPLNDSFKRHAYQSVVKLSNPAGRKEQ